MSEEDLMLLEEYLDGEMSAADARAVEERAGREPALGAELARLRADRALRLRAWRSMEGDPAAVEAVAGRIGASIERRESFGKLIKGLRMGGAAAACVLLGLTIGWMARTQPAGVGSHMAMDNADSTAAGVTPAVASSQDPIQWVGRLNRGYQVQLKDETGKVVAVQYFPTLEQAREFSKDVGEWQERQKQIRNGNVTFVGDRF